MPSRVISIFLSFFPFSSLCVFLPAFPLSVSLSRDRIRLCHLFFLTSLQAWIVSIRQFFPSFFFSLSLSFSLFFSYSFLFRTYCIIVLYSVSLARIISQRVLSIIQRNVSHFNKFRDLVITHSTCDMAIFIALCYFTLC